MIFNRLKLAASKKKIAQLVEERESIPFPVNLRSLGIIADARNIKSITHLQKIKEELNLSDSHFKLVLFTPNDKIKDDFSGIKFNLKHIDNKANIIHEELNKFTVEGVDLLITFAGESNTAVHLVTAYCEAGIKVGRFQQNKALYDLILQTEEDASLFVEELLKYLKRIKRI